MADLEQEVCQYFLQSSGLSRFYPNRLKSNNLHMFSATKKYVDKRIIQIGMAFPLLMKFEQHINIYTQGEA